MAVSWGLPPEFNNSLIDCSHIGWANPTPTYQQSSPPPRQRFTPGTGIPMKRILLMRHAKSSWDSPELTDKERPLNARGQRAASDMASWLPRQERLPQLVLHSSSTRTTQTVDLLQQVWSCQDCCVDTQSIDGLYLAPPQAILDTLGQLSDEITTVLLVAHNPGLEELVSYIDRQYHRFPTAAVADVVMTESRWDLALTDPRGFLNVCRLENVWRPKEIFDAIQRDAS